MYTPVAANKNRPDNATVGWSFLTEISLTSFVGRLVGPLNPPTSSSVRAGHSVLPGTRRAIS